MGAPQEFSLARTDAGGASRTGELALLETQAADSSAELWNEMGSRLEVSLVLELRPIVQTVKLRAKMDPLGERLGTRLRPAV